MNVVGHLLEVLQVRPDQHVSQGHKVAVFHVFDLKCVTWKKVYDKIGCVSGDRSEEFYINCAPGIFPAPDLALATIGVWDERV